MKSDLFGWFLLTLFHLVSDILRSYYNRSYCALASVMCMNVRESLQLVGKEHDVSYVDFQTFDVFDKNRLLLVLNMFSFKR